MGVSKRERLVEFFRRLSEVPNAPTFDEALEQVATTMNATEDELKGGPNVPPNWREDGRMYPPQMDAMRPVPGHPRVQRFRTAGHNVFIGENGSLQIVALNGTIEVEKPGADGRGVWELD